MITSVAVFMFVLWVTIYWGMLGIWYLLCNDAPRDAALDITWGVAMGMLIYHTNKD